MVVALTRNKAEKKAENYLQLLLLRQQTNDGNKTSRMEPMQTTDERMHAMIRASELALFDPKHQARDPN